VQQKKAHPGTPAVLNMSLEGTGASTAFDQAVAAALDAGITVVVAAGNAGDDACASSPSRVAGVLAVAASDRADGFAPFSNRGSCIALAAPGVDVASAWAGSDREVRVMSGTSVAAPFVSGAAALYLAQHPSANPDEVRAALVTHATSGALTGVPIATPNRLLAVDFLQGAGTGLSPTGLRGPRLDHF
jgi:subtilisin family serine protease